MSQHLICLPQSHNTYIILCDCEKIKSVCLNIVTRVHNIVIKKIFKQTFQPLSSYVCLKAY